MFYTYLGNYLIKDIEVVYYHNAHDVLIYVISYILLNLYDHQFHNIFSYFLRYHHKILFVVP